MMMEQRRIIPLFVVSVITIVVIVVIGTLLYAEDDNEQGMCPFDKGDRDFMTNSKCIAND